MSGMGCYGYENNIVQCRNKGWMTYENSACNSHKNDASVICYKNGKGTVGHIIGYIIFGTALQKWLWITLLQLFCEYYAIDTKHKCHVVINR